MTFIQQCGPFFYPLFLISLTILYLGIRRTTDLLKANELNDHAFSRGLNGIIFWGVFSAILGVLGQFTALYKSLSIIIVAEAINPRLVVLGVRESFLTTLYGMTQLLIAGIIWFGLFTRFRKLQNTA